MHANENRPQKFSFHLRKSRIWQACIVFLLVIGDCSSTVMSTYRQVFVSRQTN